VGGRKQVDRKQVDNIVMFIPHVLSIEAHNLVLSLADKPPLFHDREQGLVYCTLCYTEWFMRSQDGNITYNHEPTCLWRMAVEYVKHAEVFNKNMRGDDYDED